MQPPMGQPRIIRLAARAERLAVEALSPGPVRFLSLPGAGGFLGVAGWRALVGEAAWPLAILDCGDAPGHALAALRGGARAVVLDGAHPSFPAVAAAAATVGAALLPAAPPALDLARVRLDRAAGRAHLARLLALPAPGELG